MDPNNGEKLRQIQQLMAYQNWDSLAEISMETSARHGRKIWIVIGELLEAQDDSSEI